MALSDDDKIKEQIRFNIEILKILGLGIVTTSGGTVALYIEGSRMGLTVTGIGFLVLMGILGAAIIYHTRQLLR